MGKTLSLEQKIGRVKFLILQKYQVKDGSGCKKK